MAGLDASSPQSQTRVLEIAAEHETGKLVCDYADENSRLIFGPDSPNTNPYNPSFNPDVLDIVITSHSRLSDYLFRTKLGPPHDSHGHFVSLVLSPPLDCADFRRTE